MTASWLADKIEQWPTNKLLPYARNARTHFEEQVMQIADSIAEPLMCRVNMLEASGRANAQRRLHAQH